MEVEVARVVVGSTVVVDDGVGDATDEENSEEMDEAMEESSAEVDVLAAGADEVEPGAELVVAVAGLVVDADMLLVVVGAAEVAGEEEEGEVEVEAALARKRCGRKVKVRSQKARRREDGVGMQDVVK